MLEDRFKLGCVWLKASGLRASHACPGQGPWGCWVSTKKTDKLGELVGALAQRRALGLEPRTAEGSTQGAPANKSRMTGLTYTSQRLFSLRGFPGERVGGRGGGPNGKHVSSTFQQQLPACATLASPSARAYVWPCPWHCHLGPSLHSQFAPPRARGPIFLCDKPFSSIHISFFPWAMGVPVRQVQGQVEGPIQSTRTYGYLFQSHGGFPEFCSARPFPLALLLSVQWAHLWEPCQFWDSHWNCGVGAEWWSISKDPFPWWRAASLTPAWGWQKSPAEREETAWILLRMEGFWAWWWGVGRVGSDHSGPFCCKSSLNIHSTGYFGAAAPAQVMGWVLGTQLLVPALEKLQQAPGSSITDWNPIHSITFHPWRNLGPNCPKLFVVIQSLSHVWLFVTPWTAAPQASLESKAMCVLSCSVVSNSLQPHGL